MRCAGTCTSPQLLGKQCERKVKDSVMYCHDHIDQRPVKVQCHGTCTSPQLLGKQCERQVRWEAPYCHDHANQNLAAKSVQPSPKEPVVTPENPSFVDTRPRRLVYPSPAPVNVKEPIVMPEAPSTPIFHQTRPRHRHRAPTATNNFIDSTRPRPSTRTKDNADGALFLRVLFMGVMLFSLFSGAPAAPSNALSLGSSAPVAATPKWVEAISAHLEAISASTAYALHRVWASTSTALNTAAAALTGVRDHTTTFLQQGLSYVEEFVQVGGETAVGAVRSLQKGLRVAGEKAAGARRFMGRTLRAVYAEGLKHAGDALAAVTQSVSCTTTSRLVSRHAHTLMAAAVHAVRSCDHSRASTKSGCPIMAVC